MGRCLVYSRTVRHQSYFSLVWMGLCQVYRRTVRHQSYFSLVRIGRCQVYSRTVRHQSYFSMVRMGRCQFRTMRHQSYFSMVRMVCCQFRTVRHLSYFFQFGVDRTLSSVQYNSETSKLCCPSSSFWACITVETGNVNIFRLVRGGGRFHLSRQLHPLQQLPL
jgi:hypothetical protein